MSAPKKTTKKSTIRKRQKKTLSKSTFKKILMLAYLPILIGLFFAGYLVFKAVEKPVIGFFNLPSNIQDIFQEQANSWISSYKKEFKYIEIDPNLSQAEQLKIFKKCDLVFTHTSLATEFFAPYSQGPSQNVLNLMPSSMRKAARSTQNSYALPLLFDHFELAWNKKYLLQTNIESPLTFAHLFEAKKQLQKSVRYPFICAGAHDATLLGLVSALTEASQGTEAWNAIINAARTLSPEHITEIPELQNTLNLLIEWRKAGFIHPEWFRMTQTDIHAFMENNYTIFVAMFLSDHRTIEHKTIEKYDSIYFPSIDGRSNRAFIAPSYLALLPKRKKINPFSQGLYQDLMQNKTQEKISSASGLSPANAQCETADRQASDVRLWIAASQEPLPSFATTVYTQEADITQSAATIRTYIETEGR